MNMDDRMKIPMSSPDITEAERRAVQDVINTPILSMGGRIKEFEQAFCDLSGAKYAIGVSSGTAGLHLCVRAAGIGAGDYVITSPFSFVASTNVLLFENAVPVFVDVDPKTGNIDPALVADAAKNIQRYLPRISNSEYRTSNLKAILPIDVFGQPADMDPLNAIAREHGLRVIEDSCEALGATYKGRQAGRLGEFGVFAFYPNKQITTGEGGMILTDDEEAANLMLALRNQGRAPGDTWLSHTHLGYNYRLDEMSAALGTVQLARLDELLTKRETVAGWYAQRLGGIPEIELPFIESDAHVVVRVCHPRAKGHRPRCAGQTARSARRAGASVFPADPFAALYGRTLRLPRRRFPRHRRPGPPRTGRPLQRHDDRGTGRICV
jgi:dTDP-4-amino-4,6-dideoxygalactose transaminase